MNKEKYIETAKKIITGKHILETSVCNGISCGDCPLDEKEWIISLHNKSHKSGFTLQVASSDGAKFVKGKLSVIISQSKELNNKTWIHLSMARPNKYISYEEMIYVKNIFLGDIKAFMVLPTKSHHVNIHKYCFHLWHCIDGDDVPDFDRGMGTI